MDAISAAASIVALYQISLEIAKLCFHYRQDVRHGSRDSQLFMDEIARFQSSLIKLSYALSEEDSDATGQDRLKNVREVVDHQSKSFSECKADLERIQVTLEKGVVPDQGVKGLIRRLTWPVKADEVGRVIDRMHTVEQAIERAVAMDSNETIRRIDSRIQTMEFSMKDSNEQQKEQHELLETERAAETLRRRRDYILALLKHPDPSEIHRTACRQRNGETDPGKWLLESNEFQQLMLMPHALLWLHGIPGCGKTVLSSVVIDHLRHLQENDPSVAVAYWYFSANEKCRGSLDNVLRALICQFIPLDPAEMPESISELYDSRTWGNEAPKTSELSSVLKKVIAEGSASRYFVVLDALDEWVDEPTDRQALFDIIRDLSSSGKSRVSVLVTSRTLNEIEVALSSFPDLLQLSMKRQSDHDISQHIIYQLQNDSILRLWPERDKTRIKESLFEKAQGMFRWVDCQLQALRKCRKPADLDRALRTLPKDLYEQYARELASIQDGDSEDALQILQWVAFSPRELQLEEAVEMLAVNFNFDPPRFIEEDRMFNPRLVLEVCGSLVRTNLKKTKRNSRIKATAESLSVTHATVLDFLKSGPITVGSLHATLFSKGAINLQMAETCLSYLAHLAKQDLKISEETLVHFPFARYCAEFWPHHYREATLSGENLDMVRVNGMVIRLLENRKAALTYVQLCDPENDSSGVSFSQRKRNVREPMYYAALLGLTNIVQYFLDNGVLVDGGEPAQDTYLIAAIKHSRPDVVNLLLGRGSDPTKPGQGKLAVGSPLAIAVEYDQVEIVKILLRQPGVTIDSVRMPSVINQSHRGNNDRSPSGKKESRRKMNEGGDSRAFGPDFDVESASEGMVYIATDFYSMKTLKFLLQNNADPNSIGGLFHTPLIAACSWGVGEVVKLLLDCGAKVDIYGGWYGSALQAACQRSNHLPIIKLLVERGIDVDIQADDGETALWVAADKGYRDFVRLLLEKGAEVNPCGENALDPLQIACWHGHLEIAGDLIAAGADVNYKGDEYGCALYAACSAGHENVARLLLDHGASPNINGCGYYDTPLQCASARGLESLVSLLLEHGADIELEGGVLSNCLQAACRSQKASLAKLLIDKGISANVKGGEMTYPLLQACHDGNEEIVLLLLENGANPNAINEDGSFTASLVCTPLQLCTKKEIAAKLLDHGADINTRAGEYGSALGAAIFRDDLPMATFFVEHGADVNLTYPSYGITALLSAADLGYLDIVRYLIASEANLDTKDTYGHTTLTLATCSGSFSEAAMSYLRSLGLKPQNADVRGVSDLHYAASSGNAEVLEWIIEAGAEPYAIDQNGWSALHWAAKSEQCSVRIMKILRRAGVDPYLRDRQGRTAQDVSSGLDKLDEVAVLSANHATFEQVSEENDGEELDPWDGLRCRACRGARGNRYRCIQCFDFQLCFRCVLDQKYFHPEDHEFKLEFEDGLDKGLDSAAFVGDAVKRDSSFDKPHLQTSAPGAGLVELAGDTPLEERWLNERFAGYTPPPRVETPEDRAIRRVRSGLQQTRVRDGSEDTTSSLAQDENLPCVVTSEAHEPGYRAPSNFQAWNPAASNSRNASPTRPSAPGVSPGQEKYRPYAGTGYDTAAQSTNDFEPRSSGTPFQQNDSSIDNRRKSFQHIQESLPTGLRLGSLDSTQTPFPSYQSLDVVQQNLGRPVSPMTPYPNEDAPQQLERPQHDRRKSSFTPYNPNNATNVSERGSLNNQDSPISPQDTGFADRSRRNTLSPPESVPMPAYSVDNDTAQPGGDSNSGTYNAYVPDIGPANFEARPQNQHAPTYPPYPQSRPGSENGFSTETPPPPQTSPFNPPNPHLPYFLRPGPSSPPTSTIPLPTSPPPPPRPPLPAFSLPPQSPAAPATAPIDQGWTSNRYSRVPAPVLATHTPPPQLSPPTAPQTVQPPKPPPRPPSRAPPPPPRPPKLPPRALSPAFPLERDSESQQRSPPPDYATATSTPIATNSTSASLRPTIDTNPPLPALPPPLPARPRPHAAPHSHSFPNREEQYSEPNPGRWRHGSAGEVSSSSSSSTPLGHQGSGSNTFAAVELPGSDALRPAALRTRPAAPTQPGGGGVHAGAVELPAETVPLAGVAEKKSGGRGQGIGGERERERGRDREMEMEKGKDRDRERERQRWAKGKVDYDMYVNDRYEDEE